MLPDNYRKRSFLRFDVPVDLPRLQAEYRAIPDDEWQASYWGNIHCSVGMLLLRGGETGTEQDFFAETVRDNPLLEQLPYIRSLIAPDGPFGGATYAFIFRMEPNGLTQAHRDLIETWHDMFRIHLPIQSNSRARLISDGYAQHFTPGHAWSFDNQSWHGVVNGSAERVHLILDVPFNPVLQARIDTAQFVQGEKRDDLVAKIEAGRKSRTSYPGDLWVGQAVAKLRGQGLDDGQIADAFNQRKIPPRRYFVKNQRRQVKGWDAAMVAAIPAA